jgi:NADH dehydrogenase [ubiquinone] 1 alpha subcomplex assembly factor 1
MSRWHVGAVAWGIVASSCVGVGCANGERETTDNAAAPTPSAAIVPTAAAGAVATESIVAASPAEPTPTTITKPATITEPSMTTAPLGPAVFSFPSAGSIDGWRSQNDPVMGGLSTGTVTWENNALVFEGVLSLDNGGGFASLISPPFDEVPQAWLDGNAITLDVTGDGQTYVLQLRTGASDSPWIQRFGTVSATAAVVTLGWTAFEPVDRFLNPVEASAPLDRADIMAIAIYILDKQQGPFRIALRSVS